MANTNQTDQDHISNGVGGDSPRECKTSSALVPKRTSKHAYWWTEDIEISRKQAWKTRAYQSSKRRSAPDRDTAQFNYVMARAIKAANKAPKRPVGRVKKAQDQTVHRLIRLFEY